MNKRRRKKAEKFTALPAFIRDKRRAQPILDAFIEYHMKELREMMAVMEMDLLMYGTCEVKVEWSSDDVQLHRMDPYSTGWNATFGDAEIP